MSDLKFPAEKWSFAEPGEVGVDSDALESAMKTMAEFTLDQGADQAMVVRDGSVIWSGKDIDNVHPVWSCSKSFTSMCLGLMLDDGLCELDEPIAKYAPFMQKLYPELTIRQCAAFTAGFQQRNPEPADFAANPFDPIEAIFEHGTRYHYSMATDVLAYALTKMAGQPLYDLYQKRIGKAIGIDARYFKWGDWNEFALLDGKRVNGGSGCFAKGVWISARQMARVGWLACNYGKWNGQQLISREYFEQATTPQSRPDTPPHNPEAWYLRLPGSYGLNWWLNGMTHDGKRQWPHAPEDTFALQGNNNNICLAIPQWRMVIVRLGTDGIVSTDLYDDVFKILADAITD